MFSITIKKNKGNKHTYYINENTRLKLKGQVKNKSGKYIEKRVENLDGHSVDYALNKYLYKDRNGIMKKYNKTDLTYDIKMGRLEFIFPEQDESYDYDNFSEENIEKRVKNIDHIINGLESKITEMKKNRERAEELLKDLQMKYEELKKKCQSVRLLFMV